MQIAAHVLAYNVNRFLRPMLENAAPWVDKIFIAYPSRPFTYVAESRQTLKNPTRVEEHLPAEFLSKIEIIKGDWATDEESRNACLKRALEQGFDWLIVQDADEFYPEISWKRLRQHLARNPKAEAWKTTWYQFWKSAEFVIEESGPGSKGANASFAVRCKPHLRFADKRSLNVPVPAIDEPCYHYGWALTDAEMKEKIVTWSHSAEFNAQRWFDLKWKYWSFETRNLHPVYPVEWKRALRFPQPQPDFAWQFMLELERPEVRPFSSFTSEHLYDLRARLHPMARNFKRTFTGFQGRNQ